MGAHPMREDEAAPSWRRMLKGMLLFDQPQILHTRGRALASRHGAAEPTALNKGFIQCKTSSAICWWTQGQV